MNAIVLKTFTGTAIGTGEIIEWDRDEILVNGTRVGFISHFDDAPICLTRIISEPTIKEIHAAVVQQRAEQGKPTVAEKVCRLPDPNKLRAALKQRQRTRA